MNASDKQPLEPNVFYRHYELPPSFPVIGLLGPYWESTSGQESPLRLHFHNCLEIGYFYKGSCTYHTAEGSWHVEAPCIFLTPANVPHMTVADEGVTCGWNWIYTDPSQLLTGVSPSVLHSLGKQLRTLTMPQAVISAESAPAVYALVEMIAEELQTGDSGHDLIVRELFSALFLKLMRILPRVPVVQSAANARMSALAPAMTCISENYMNDLSIEELAQLCHVSPSHFRRLFKSLLGLPPRDYLHMVRVERACALLSGGKYSVTEIGLMVGYPSPSSFTRQFHRLYGISPRQWRQKMPSEENPAVNAYLTGVPAGPPIFPRKNK